MNEDVKRAKPRVKISVSEAVGLSLLKSVPVASRQHIAEKVLGSLKQLSEPARKSAERLIRESQSTSSTTVQE